MHFKDEEFHRSACAGVMANWQEEVNIAGTVMKHWTRQSIKKKKKKKNHAHTYMTFDASQQKSSQVPCNELRKIHCCILFSFNFFQGP